MPAKAWMAAADMEMAKMREEEKAAADTLKGESATRSEGCGCGHKRHLVFADVLRFLALAALCGCGCEEEENRGAGDDQGVLQGGSR